MILAVPFLRNWFRAPALSKLLKTAPTTVSGSARSQSPRLVRH
jgi:hypothetical protein